MDNVYVKDENTGLYLGDSSGLLVSFTDAKEFELERAKYLVNWFSQRDRHFVIVDVTE